MNVSQQLSNHVFDIYFGKNWTATNFRDTLKGITLEEALTKVHGLNSIAALVHHINYYVSLQLRVLEGGPLEGSDKISFNHPEFKTQEEWDNYLKGILEQALVFSEILGNYYHFGQIVIIRKIIENKSATT